MSWLPSLRYRPSLAELQLAVLIPPIYFLPVFDPPPIRASNNSGHGQLDEWSKETMSVYLVHQISTNIKGLHPGVVGAYKVGHTAKHSGLQLDGTAALDGHGAQLLLQADQPFILTVYERAHILDSRD